MPHMGTTPLVNKLLQQYIRIILICHSISLAPIY